MIRTLSSIPGNTSPVRLSCSPPRLAPDQWALQRTSFPQRDDSLCSSPALYSWCKVHLASPPWRSSTPLLPPCSLTHRLPNTLLSHRHIPNLLTEFPSVFRGANLLQPLPILNDLPATLPIHYHLRRNHRVQGESRYKTEEDQLIIDFSQCSKDA